MFFLQRKTQHFCGCALRGLICHQQPLDTLKLLICDAWLSDADENPQLFLLASISAQARGALVVLGIRQWFWLIESCAMAWNSVLAPGRGGWRGKLSTGNAEGAHQLAGAEPSPEAAPLDVIASRGNAAALGALSTLQHHGDQGCPPALSLRGPGCDHGTALAGGGIATTWAGRDRMRGMALN